MDISGKEVAKEWETMGQDGNNDQIREVTQDELDAAFERWTADGN